MTPHPETKNRSVFMVLLVNHRLTKLSMKNKSLSLPALETHCLSVRSVRAMSKNQENLPIGYCFFFESNSDGDCPSGMVP